MTIHPTFCRICYHLCGAMVEVDEEGRAISMTGDRDNPIYKGYHCVKGRASPSIHNSPERLLHTMKRMPDGKFERIDVNVALDEIAEKLAMILKRDGPRAIASYHGTGIVGQTLAMASTHAFMEAIDSPMSFSNESIDQPGKSVAKGLHGVWQAPGNGWREPDVILVIGMNPLVSHNGFPFGNPAAWINDRIAKGTKLIVIDPRRTETARKATQFLQPLPGQDAAILSAIARIIIDEKLYDHAFVAEHTQGLDELRAALDRFDAKTVASVAGIDADELETVARTYAAAKRGYAICGTGPSMSGSSTLIEYLRMCIETLCGHYMREGELLPVAGVTMAAPVAKAQATPPFPAWGEKFGGPSTRVRGLRAYFAGSAPMPTSALPDEILMPGEGQVRAFICCAGNPVLAWPDQNRTVTALNSLELSVAIDIKMTPSAALADYVIACKQHLETPGLSYLSEGLAFYSTGVGVDESYGQYTPAIVQPPKGSQVVEEWEVFYGLCQRLGLPFTIHGLNGTSFSADMARKPTTDDLLAQFMAGSRITFEELRRHPHGAIFPDHAAMVLPKDRYWEGRLQLADSDMIADLQDYLLAPDQETGFPFRMISRRMRHTFNSIAHDPATKGLPYNPAFMNPADLDALGLASGDVIELRSRYGAILGVVEQDRELRPGLVSMSHGYGAGTDRDDELLAIGSPTSRLSGLDDFPERYSGQPRMSAIPVQIRKSATAERLIQPNAQDESVGKP
jgi:Anaerobic dehydrogenases, typically selenocysteine-containing